MPTKLKTNKDFTDGYEKGYSDAQAELPTSLYVDGFNDGYKKGRADKDKELSELPNQYSEKLWKNAHDRGYEQGREDAIDEYMNKLKLEFHPCLNCISYSTDECNDEDYFQDCCVTEKTFSFEDIINFGEHLKEQLKEQK